VLLKISVSWDVTPCRWAATSRRFEGSWYSWVFSHVGETLLCFDTSETNERYGVISQKMGIFVTKSNLDSCYICVEDGWWGKYITHLFTSHAKFCSSICLWLLLKFAISDNFMFGAVCFTPYLFETNEDIYHTYIYPLKWK